MSHNIRKKGEYYCTKCGAHTEDSLKELCKNALHEEQIKIAMENKKFCLFLSCSIIAIMFFVGFFAVLFEGFDRVTVAINQVMVKADLAYKECLKGGWIRLMKALFNKQ